MINKQGRIFRGNMRIGGRASSFIAKALTIALLCGSQSVYAAENSSRASKSENSISENYELNVKESLASIKVTGVVTISSTGEPLIGVNVVEKGTINGTMTDHEGRYNLTVNEGATLVISYISFVTQEIKVGSKTNIDVKMIEDSKVLSDVVVTALGIKREVKSLTYNVQRITTDDLTTVKDANFVTSLSGKIAGAQINSSASGLGGSARVILRGPKSISGNNNALYVVDGVPLQDVRREQPSGFFESPDGGDGDGFSNLNADDIEDISVLTGAAASALYGGSGANGVILITTKKGHDGKLKINYSNNTTFMNPLVMPEFQNKYGSKLDEFSSWGALLPGGGSGYKPKDFFQTGYNETNSINASFGNEMMQNYISVAVLNGRGIIPNNTLNRYNLTFRNTSELIKDKLSLDISVSFVNERNRNMIAQGQYHNPLLPVYLFPRGDDFNKYKVYETYNEGRNFKTQNWPGKYGNQSLGIENPYWTTNRKLFENDIQRYIGYAGLNYKVLDWLTASGRIRVDKLGTVFTRKIHASSDRLFASENGNYMKMNMSDRQLYADLMLSVDKKFGEDFSLVGALGVSYDQYDTNVSSFEGHLNKIANLFTYANIDKSHQETKGYETGAKDQRESIFATAQLGYQSKVFLDLTARNDRYSMLAFANKKNIFYPSVGFSGIMSDIFDVSAAKISFWKIRASYSEVGNPPSRFLTYPTYPLTSGGNFIPTTVSPFRDLKPERTKSYEVGTTLNMFDNKLTLDGTYYNSNTYDQVLEFEVSGASGYNKFLANSGKINNWGIEASLGYKEKLGPVSWNTNFLFGMNRNKVKELVRSVKDPDGNLMDITEMIMSSSGSYQMKLTEGGSMGDIYVTGLLKDNDGNVKVDPSTGTIQADPSKWIKAGSALPRYNFGWTNTFAYKGFELSFQIDARIGGVGVSATQALMDRYGVSKASAQARDRGGVPVNGGMIDPEAYYSVVGGGTSGVLSEYVYSMTNVRLREASLTYNFPTQWFDNKIAGLSVSLIGRNLIMFHNRAPFDPEITASTGTFYQGFDYFMQPSLRNIGFSARVQF